MQSTHKIAGADAEGFATYLTSENGRGDYYIDGEDTEGEGAQGVWHGSPEALGKLGLSADRPVQRDELIALMNGKAPNDGREIRAVGGNGTRVAGIDLTYNPPKSVSALWAASSGEHREAIEKAHRDAVESTLKHIERDVELVRTREAGQLKWQAANSLVAAQFLHTSSRLTRDQEKGGVPDPHLHTHVVVLAAERKDGSFAAVDSRELFRSARVNGAWYRSQLAHNLQNAGLEIERHTGKDGRYFELKGVPSELVERWSTRAAQIEKAARDFRARYGRDPKGREISALTTSTRGTKTLMAQVNVDGAWKAIASEHGLTREQAHALFTAREHEREQNARRPDVAKEVVEHVTAHSSMVSERDLMAIAYERSAGAVGPEQARALVKDLMRSGALIQLQGGMWTTRALRERELRTVATVRERATERAAPVSEQAIRDAERDVAREIGAPLTNEQKEAVRTIMGEGGVTVLVGQAGTGKGVVLRTATSAWQREGYHVIGTAIAGATAERLAADARTDKSMTTDALLLRAEKGTLNLGKDTVVVMDEAGMADSKRLPDLISLTNETESKLILAGDGAQLSPIGAGGLFKEINDRTPSAELTEVFRARHEWERRAWRQVRDGEASKALASYRAHDRLHITDTREQAAEQMVADWARQRLEVPERKALMLTDASNEELDRINKLAQAHRIQAGELGATRAHAPDLPYTLAEGDHVLFTKSQRIPGQDRVENGTLATVRRVNDEDDITVQTHGANERDVNVKGTSLADLRLAYAQNVYKAQGTTVERSFVLIGGWQTNRERAYVAITRAQDQTQIYLSHEDQGHQGLDPDLIERFAISITETHAQQASITRTAVFLQRESITNPQQRETAHFVNEQPTASATTAHAHEQAEENSTAQELADRNREPIQLTNNQQHPDPDPDQDRGFDLGIE